MGNDQHILVKVSFFQDKINIALSSEDYFVIDDLTSTNLTDKVQWKEQVQELYQRGTRLHFQGDCWQCVYFFYGIFKQPNDYHIVIYPFLTDSTDNWFVIVLFLFLNFQIFFLPTCIIYFKLRIIIRNYYQCMKNVTGSCIIRIGNIAILYPVRWLCLLSQISISNACNLPHYHFTNLSDNVCFVDY